MRWERQRSNWEGESNPNYKGGKEYPCVQCGTMVYRMPSSLKKHKNIFCSPKCHDDFRRKPKPERKPAIGDGHWRWSGKKGCPICKIELIGARARRRKTCGSEECTNKLKSQSHVGDKNPKWRKGKVHCKRCGAEITKNDRWSRTFCGRKCMGIWQSENLSGENSPIWKGPGNRENETYPPEWNYKLRLKIRRRDDFTCQNCGKRQKGLDIHHIDGDKWNCNPLNLICLCRSCHRFVQSGKIPCPAPQVFASQPMIDVR